MKPGGGALRGGMPLYKWIGNRILTRFENAVLGLDAHVGLARGGRLDGGVDLDRLRLLTGVVPVLLLRRRGLLARRQDEEGGDADEDRADEQVEQQHRRGAADDRPGCCPPHPGRPTPGGESGVTADQRHSDAEGESFCQAGDQVPGPGLGLGHLAGDDAQKIQQNF